jgi:hypothetical protein
VFWVGYFSALIKICAISTGVYLPTDSIKKYFMKYHFLKSPDLNFRFKYFKEIDPISSSYLHFNTQAHCLTMSSSKQNPFSSIPQSVKTEPSPSPEPARFSFHSLPPSLSSAHNSPNPVPHQSVFRFNGAHHPSSDPSSGMIYTDQHWSEASSSHHPNAGSFHNNIGLQYAMSFGDDYDDISEVTDGITGLGRTNESGSSAGDRAVKRRSSKGQFPIVCFTLHLISPMTFFSL